MKKNADFIVNIISDKYVPLFDKNDNKISNAEDFKIDISGIKLGDAINKFSEKRC